MCGEVHIETRREGPPVDGPWAHQSTLRVCVDSVIRDHLRGATHTACPYIHGPQRRALPLPRITTLPFPLFLFFFLFFLLPSLRPPPPPSPSTSPLQRMHSLLTSFPSLSSSSFTVLQPPPPLSRRAQTTPPSRPCSKTFVITPKFRC